MALTDKDLYDYAERFLAFETEAGLDIEGLKKFAKETEALFSNEEKARMLNLAQEIRYGNQDKEDTSDTSDEDTISEEAVTEGTIL